jgi:hypothetical protein
MGHLNVQTYIASGMILQKPMPLWGRVHLIWSQELPRLKTLNQLGNIEIEVNIGAGQQPPGGLGGLFVLTSDSSSCRFTLSLLLNWFQGFCRDVGIGLRLGVILIVILLIVACRASMWHVASGVSNLCGADGAAILHRSTFRVTPVISPRP